MRRTVGKRIEYITPTQMNKILAENRNKIKYYVDYEYAKDKDFTQNLTSPCIYVVDNALRFMITTQYKGANTTFITYKDGREIMEDVSGAQVFNEFSLYWKVPRVELNDAISATPILGFNPDYEYQRLDNCYSYDLNSAYSAAMLRGWIDLGSGPANKRIDPETEIGFEFDDDGILRLQHYGRSSMVFKKMETPIGVRRYVEKWYQQKKNAKTAEEKQIAKKHLNYIVGFFQRVNPWLRAWIVCSCNEQIEELLDENSLFWNTDSIASKTRRLDLEENLGAEIGQWKIEHTGKVAYKGVSYQWNNDKPTYRGIVKKWFPDDYDILRDPLPECGNDWEFNKKTFQLEATEWQKLNNLSSL